MSYGTGAIMAVPAHDERDWEFAKKFNMPIIQVVESSEGPVDVNEAAFVDVATGKLVNSGFLNGMEVAEAKKAIIEYLEKRILVHRKPTTSCVTGYFPDSVTGASRSRSFTVTSVAMCRFRKISFRWSCPM